MAELSCIDLPRDTVGSGILIATAFEPLTMRGILAVLANIGAPSWQPVDDVVASTVDRLCRQGLLAAAPPDCFAPTAAARIALPRLIDAVPLSSSSHDIGYKLRVMSLDLLDPMVRAAQLAALAAHWRGILALWQNAQDHCPCQQPAVRHWMKHNLSIARSEIDWLSSLAEVSPS